MKEIDVVKKLVLVRRAALALWIIAGGFVAYKHYFIGIVIMLGASFIDWEFDRCPHCNSGLDMRIRIDDTMHCPYCGEIIAKKISF